MIGLILKLAGMLIIPRSMKHKRKENSKLHKYILIKSSKYEVIK